MIIFWIILLIFIVLILPILSMYWQDRFDGNNKDKPLKSYFYEPPEQKYAKEIADGTVVVIKSELSTAQRCMFWIVCGVLIILLFLGLFHFLDYLEALAKTCKPIFGLNPMLIDDLIRIFILPLILITVAWSDYLKYLSIKGTKGFYPPLSSQPKYQDVVCHKINSDLVEKKKKSFFGAMVIAIICISLGLIQLHVPIAQLFDANTIYNQKCEAQAYPFDRFHKKSE